jgi:hypothetical protein
MVFHPSKSQHHQYSVETHALGLCSPGAGEALRGRDWVTICFCRLGSGVPGRFRTREVEP